MPLKLNCGLSRKVGEANYGSRGASVNVELELESALIGEPAKLQERIRQLFTLVRTSLAEELNGNGHAPSPGTENGQPKVSSGINPPTRTNGPRLATQSQVKAIYAISRTQRIEIGPFLNERYQVSRPTDLTISQASAVIDELKGNRNNGRAA